MALRGEVTQIEGFDLQVGDVMVVWWCPKGGHPNRDRVIEINTYNGKLLDLWPKGARTARFASGAIMTVGNEELIEVLVVDPPTKQR